MPVLLVYGIPKNTKVTKLSQFCENLRLVAADIKELNITVDQVSVFFPTDRLEEGLGEEIIVFVEGLFDRPERTKKVRKDLATAVAKTIRSYFSNTKMVECFVKPFNPDLGFAET